MGDINRLQEQLNPNFFSTDTLIGLLIWLLIIGICVCAVRKIMKLVWIGAMSIVLTQILHVFAQSKLGLAVAPWLQTYLPANVLQMLAQPFNHTPVAQGLLWLQIMFDRVFGTAFDAVYTMWIIAYPFLHMIWSSITSLGT